MADFNLDGQDIAADPTAPMPLRRQKPRKMGDFGAMPMGESPMAEPSAPKETTKAAPIGGVGGALYDQLGTAPASGGAISAMPRVGGSTLPPGTIPSIGGYGDPRGFNPSADIANSRNGQYYGTPDFSTHTLPYRPNQPAPPIMADGGASPTGAPATATGGSKPLNYQDVLAQEKRWLDVANKFSTGASSRGGGFAAGGNAYRNNLQPLVDEYNKQYGAHATAIGDDSIDFGDGQGKRDVITSGGDFWYQEPDTADNPNSRGGGGASGGGGGTGGGTGGGGGSMGSGGIQGAIMRLLGRGEANVDPNDPNIAGPTGAFRQQTDAATRRSRNALAERDAASGLNSGGAGSGSFDSAIQSQQEQAGRDVGSYQSGLMVQELQARRQDVVNALQFAQGEEKLALEQKLAEMNDSLGRMQLGQQNQQFYDRMGYDMGRDTQQYNYLYNQLAAG